MQTTYVPKRDEIHRRWHLIDATDKVLGRLCSEVARILSGKNKAMVTPHADTGDHVVVIHAAKVALTGKKLGDKEYYRYTGYPGGLRTETASERMKTRPDRLVLEGVKGMLPKTKLGRAMFKKLKVYVGSEHPHEAQQPELLALASAAHRGEKK